MPSRTRVNDIGAMESLWTSSRVRTLASGRLGFTIVNYMSFEKILLLLASSGVLLAETEFSKPEGIAAATGYSHVVLTRPGKLVFIAGQVANNREGQLVGKGDLKGRPSRYSRTSKQPSPQLELRSTTWSS
jgi:hypothetical protein